MLFSLMMWLEVVASLIKVMIIRMVGRIPLMVSFPVMVFTWFVPW